MNRVKDKVALVTGARRGLGAAIAVMLAREGAKVAISDRKADGSEAVLQQIRDAGGEAIFIEHDVSSEESWNKTISAVILTGKQPVDLTAERLKRIGKLPACWNEQRRVLRMPN